MGFTLIEFIAILILLVRLSHFLIIQCQFFLFIGLHRAPVEISEIKQCLVIAETIASTGLPNYVQASIPLKSDLNISEWEKELINYPDKMLIEYLKFGFPLTFNAPEQLHNICIVNHHSVL